VVFKPGEQVAQAAGLGGIVAQFVNHRDHSSSTVLFLNVLF
jgi:hypothetical protein